MNATDPRSSSSAVFAKIFGNPATLDIEHRVLNGIMLLALMTGTLSVLINILIGAPDRVVIASIVGLLGASLGYWVARRVRRWRLFLAPLFLLFLAVLAFSWITQAGSIGTIGYFFFLITCYAIILFKKLGRLLSLGSIATTITTLLLIEHYHSPAILPYATSTERFIDVVFSLPLCLFVTATIIYVVFRESQRERQAKDELLRLVTEEKEHVEQSMREKQRLLTIVCHDIANALTVLQGDIELIRHPHPTQPASPPSRFDRMHYACNNIGEIIASVRTIEAVEQGSIPFHLKSVDLREVFKNTEIIFSERLSQQRMRIEFPELADDVRFVMAEPRILANQVFNNLISNAIKFSYPGSTIVVTVSRQVSDIVLCVTDHGIGMPAALVGKLFDLDAMTTRPGTDGEPGTGFGMRTVKNFVDLFGGRLEITSRAENEYPTNHGTTVCVHLKGEPTA